MFESTSLNNEVPVDHVFFWVGGVSVFSPFSAKQVIFIKFGVTYRVKEMRI